MTRYQMSLIDLTLIILFNVAFRLHDALLFFKEK